ncbi:MAG: hypothetical protein EZS28_055871, partial [Streblomastix strix]
METASKIYQNNDPRYFVHGHLASVRDIALHPQLMLLASVSDDGTAAITDVSHAVKPTQKESQQSHQSSTSSSSSSTSSSSSSQQSQYSQQSIPLSFPQQTSSSSSSSQTQ